MTAAGKSTVSEPADLSWREVLHITDEELQRLPPNYRAPLVLCYLEGRTQDEAARELGWSLGALRGRLNRGRDKLRERLVRRGVTGAAALGVAALVPALGSAAVPPALIAASARASLPVAAGHGVPAQVPERVVALAREGLQTLWRAKLVSSAVVGACLAFLGTVLALFAALQPPAEPGDVAPKGDRAWSAVSRLEIPGSHLWTVAFSPNGKPASLPAPAASCPRRANSGYGTLPPARSCILCGPLRSVRCVTFAPDGRTLATAEHDGTAHVRNADSGDVLRTLRGHTSQIDGIAFSPNGKTLATCSWDGTVKLWDADTGEEVRTFTGGTEQVFGVAFRSDDVLAAGGADSTARIRETATGRTLFRLRGHGSTIHWLAFAPPNGKLLATASWDKTVRLWDAASGKPVATLTGHTEPVLAVAFSRDGQTLASASGAWGNGRTADGASTWRGDSLGLAGPPGSCPLAPSRPGLRCRLFPRWQHVGLGRLGRRRHPLAGRGGRQTTARECPEGWRTLAIRDGAGQEGGPEGPPPGKEYAKEYHAALKGKEEEVPGLLTYGPEAPECVKFEPEGLRITLPLGYPRQRSGTGVVTDFGVRGDFEITLSFEILQEPRPGFPGNPTDLMLVVVPVEHPEPDTWHKASQNQAVLSREVASPNDVGQFVADVTKWTRRYPQRQVGQ